MIVYWMRLGDSGDYEAYDDFDEITEKFTDIQWTAGGFQATGYRFYNYVSLYVGEHKDFPEYLRDLSEQEKQRFIECCTGSNVSN